MVFGLGLAQDALPAVVARMVREVCQTHQQTKEELCLERAETQWMVKAVFVLRPRKSLHVLHLLLVLLFASL